MGAAIGATTAKDRSRQWTRKVAAPLRTKKKYVVLLAIAGAIALAVASFEWNWLRGPLAGYLSARLGRPVAIAGDLDVALSMQPLLTADSVTLGNAHWSADPQMARATRVTVRLDPMSLFSSRLALPEVHLIEPRVGLERNDHGNGNWEFPGATELPLVGALEIENGEVQYRDPATETDITLKFESSGEANEQGRKPVSFSGSGTVHKSPLTIDGHAASLLALEEGERPYLVDVNARSGATVARFDGKLIPNRIDNVDGALTLQGRDLSQLHPIIPVPFPWTPAYQLRGRLMHDGEVWTFRDFSGHVGQSDVAGVVAVTGPRHRVRPLIEGDIVSQRLDLADLGGMVGLPPDGAKPGKGTPAQQAEAKRRARSPRVLPTHPYDLESLRSADAKLHFRGTRFIASSIPLDHLNAVINLEAGVMTLQPLDFGVAGGKVASTVVLDARGNVIKMRTEAQASNVDLRQILPGVKPPNGSAGKLGGRARLAGTGNSVADMLTTSNGEVALINRGGDASELAIVLTNLDLAHAAKLLLTGDRNSPVHCVVADFVAVNGKFAARNLVVDTTSEKIVGEGTIDLANERYDLALNAESKRPSLVALRGPILIEGPFRAPRVHPDPLPVAARVGASVALGVLLTPLAALLPLVDPGGGEDADCGALVQQAQQTAKAKPPMPKVASLPRGSSPR